MFANMFLSIYLIIFQGSHLAPQLQRSAAKNGERPRVLQLHSRRRQVQGRACSGHPLPRELGADHTENFAVLGEQHRAGGESRKVVHRCGAWEQFEGNREAFGRCVNNIS